MEIHQLKYFICVAKLESISKAATMLHLSQPALSKSLAKLEDELGVQLFDRLGKRLHLNDRGKLFLKGAEKALQELDGAAASVNAGTGSLQGSLSVGVFGVQDSAISCVQRFMQANRQTHVMLDARQRSITVRSVREFDMVFYPEGPAFGGIAGIPYARNRVRLAVPASHPLAAVGIADLVQFKDDPFVFMNTTAGVYEQSYAALRRKRLYALGARSDEQRHGSATAHRRWTGSRVRRRPKPLAGRACGEAERHDMPFGVEGACHALPGAAFPFQHGRRGTGRRNRNRTLRRVRGRTRLPRRGRLSRCGASTDPPSRTAQRRARANPLLRLSPCPPALSHCPRIPLFRAAALRLARRRPRGPSLRGQLNPPRPAARWRTRRQKRGEHGVLRLPYGRGVLRLPYGRGVLCLPYITTINIVIFIYAIYII